MTAETTHSQDDVNSPENLARRERGLEVAHSVDGEAAQAVIDSLADISPALAHHIAAFGFGDVYARPDLDPRSRQLVTIGVLTALGGCEPQLRIHIGAAPQRGPDPRGDHRGDPARLGLRRLPAGAQRHLRCPRGLRRARHRRLIVRTAPSRGHSRQRKRRACPHRRQRRAPRAHRHKETA